MMLKARPPYRDTTFSFFLCYDTSVQAHPNQEFHDPFEKLMSRTILFISTSFSYQSSLQHSNCKLHIKTSKHGNWENRTHSKVLISTNLLVKCNLETFHHLKKEQLLLLIHHSFHQTSVSLLWCFQSTLFLCPSCPRQDHRLQGWQLLYNKLPRPTRRVYN